MWGENGKIHTGGGRIKGHDPWKEFFGML